MKVPLNTKLMFSYFVVAIVTASVKASKVKIVLEKVVKIQICKRCNVIGESYT